MATRRPPGTPGRLLCWFRNTLAGRPIHEKPWLRLPKVLATRSPDPPCLPEGAAHKLADNYYYSRDLRRDVLPPTLSPSLKQLTEASKSDSVTSDEVAYPELTTPPVPGIGHKWTWNQTPS